MGTNLLVVAAWEPELAHFRARAQAGVRDLAVEPIGVGLVDASAGMTRCVARHSPARALFIGTCGSFTPELTRSTEPIVVAASHALLVDAAVARGEAELPAPMARELALDDAMLAALVAAGARPARVATTLGVTTSDALAADLARIADAEHLEAFAFARACSLAGIPAALALGVANPVGSHGRAAWLANHVRASAAAAEIALAALPRL